MGNLKQELVFSYFKPNLSLPQKQKAPLIRAGL
jgi:hypothetical protein